VNVKISITGLKEIDDMVKALPKEMSHSLLASAHTASAKPLVQKMQLTAPEGPTGNLVDSIGIIRTSLKRADSLGEIRVGPRRRGRYKGFHAHFVEYGTGLRQTRGRGKYKAGARRGVMTKKPFVGPSFRQTKNMVEGGIAKNIGKGVSRVMRKYAKR
jgi:HK97 gp10 family phage protein